VWLSVSKLPLKCAVVSLYSVLKQRLKCDTGKVCNCLIQFFFTTVLSIVEYFLRESNRYTDLVHEQFAEKFPETPILHRDFPNSDLQEMFENKIERVWVCVDAREHHFQQLS
jgi:hypothetical protein